MPSQALHADEWEYGVSSREADCDGKRLERALVLEVKWDQPLSTLAASPAKLKQLLLSCVLASCLCAVTFILGVLELIGALQIIHPLIWFAMASGSLGVAGSSAIYFRRLWRIR